MSVISLLVTCLRLDYRYRARRMGRLEGISSATFHMSAQLKSRNK